jgi:hypothetical protein
MHGLPGRCVWLFDLLWAADALFHATVIFFRTLRIMG